MVIFPPGPIPVVVENGKDGYVLYIETSGMLENDLFTVVLCDGGFVRHYNSSQIRIHRNATFNIEKAPPIQEGQ